MTGKSMREMKRRKRKHQQSTTDRGEGDLFNVQDSQNTSDVFYKSKSSTTRLYRVKDFTCLMPQGNN